MAAVPPSGPAGPRRARGAGWGRPRQGFLGALALGLAALGSAGCNIVDARVANLRELHYEDGRPRRQAVLMNDWEYALRNSMQLANVRFVGISDDEESDGLLGEKVPERIPDPHRSCLTELIGLASYDGADPRIGALQVELFAWLALQDRYALSRERALIELGRAVERLGGTAALETRIPETPADVETVSSAIAELSRSAVASAMGGLDASGLASSCQALLALELDVDALRRSLRTTAILLGRFGPQTPAGRTLVETSRALERRAVGQALTLALADSGARVRATAVRVWAKVAPSPPAAILEAALGDEESQVKWAALDAIARLGLPELSAAEDPALERERWLGLLFDLTAHPEGRVQVAACRALGKVSGAGFQSLQVEDWYLWWSEREAGEVRP